MMREVHLYGRLKKEFGASFRLNVATAGEAIRALNANFPGRFVGIMREGSYEVIRGESRRKGRHLGLDDVNEFKLGHADLHIVPVLKGRASGGKSKGGGGALKAIVGVALIGVAMFASGGALAAALPGVLGATGATFGTLAIVGAAMAFAGVSQLMAPKEKSSAAAETKKEDSFSFSGPGNAYEQGNPVPLIYGEIITGSVMISGGIDIEQIGSYQG